MQKYTPYIFPLFVATLVFFLVYRWYTMKTLKLESDIFGEGVQIENLSQDEMVNSIKGMGDYETVELMSSNPEVTGFVRYEVAEDKVKFSVMANLDPQGKTYAVWLKDPKGESTRKVSDLTEGKGGLIGSVSLPAELMPFEVLVGETSENSDTIDSENAVLKGILEKK